MGNEKHVFDKSKRRQRRSRSKERPHICGADTHIYYNSSSRRPRTPPINVDKMVCFAQLAIRLYNIKEFTEFDQVKVLKVEVTYSGVGDYRILFQAFTPLADSDTPPSLFLTKVRQYPAEYPTIRIMFVRIKGQLLPCNVHQHTLSQHIKTLSADYLAPCLSQFALLMYDFLTLHAHKEAVHDFPSVKVVKVRRHVADDTTYFVTFEASLRDKSKNVESFETQMVESFETQICVSTLSQTTKFEFNKIQIEHTTDTGALLAECACQEA